MDSGGFGGRNTRHGLIIGQVASMGMHCLNLGRKEAGALDPAACRATQAVMRAATADPLSDAQLEQIVKLAFGKRVPIASATMGSGDPPQATTPAMEPAGNHLAEREVESEDEGETRGITACDGQGAARITETAGDGGPVIIRDIGRAAIGRRPIGQGGGHDPRRKEDEQSGQESCQSGHGSRGRLTDCRWRPSTTSEEVTAVSGVQLNEGAGPK